MLYRVIRALAVKASVIPPGEIIRSGTLKGSTIELLVRKGTIQPVSPPPLSALTGWQHRAERLAVVGVHSVIDLVECDIDEIARHCGVSPGLVTRWQTAALEWLQPPAVKQG